MKTLLASMAFGLASLQLLAQTPSLPDRVKQLQTDPQVVWMATFYQDYDLEQPTRGMYIADQHSHYWTEYAQKLQSYTGYTLPTQTNPKGLTLVQQRIYPIKWQQPTTKGQHMGIGQISQPSEFGEYYLYDQLLTPKQGTTFALEGLYPPRYKTNYKNYLDSTVSLDPKTFAEVLSVRQRSLAPSDIVAVRIYQVMYYHQGQKTFHCLPLSMSPLVPEFSTKNNQTVFRELSPLYWQAVGDLQQPISLEQSAHLPWIKQAVTTIDPKQMTPVKTTISLDSAKRELIHHWLKERNKIYAQALAGQILSADEIQALLTSQTIEFDPQEMEEVTKKQPLSPQTLVGFSLVQNIAWDAQKRQLQIYPHAWSFLYEARNDNNDYLGSFPLLYLFRERPYR